MSIDRSLFADHFTTLPGWTCSVCQKGTLTVLSDHQVQFTPRIWIEASKDPDFEIDWTKQIFGFALQCQNPDCGQGSLVSGNVRLVLDHDEFGNQFLGDRLYPENFVSPPLIFSMSDAVPNDVRRELLKAFSLFWSDGNSAANKVRNVVEAILTSKRIPKTERSKNGKRSKLTTDRRIISFSAKNPLVGKMLMGLKWKGNANSHFTLENSSKSDLLETFELLDHVLQEIYDSRSLRMIERADALTKRKGKATPLKKNVSKSRRKKK